MKKIILIVTCAAASIPTYALPTYEPFTEYAPFIAVSNQTFTYLSNGVSIGTNAEGSVSAAVDLATNGFIAPSGEKWTSLNFAGSNGTPHNVSGLDVYVVSNSTIFTSAALSSILPNGFPGLPAAGGAITNMVENPAQPLIWITTNYQEEGYIVGNSAVLNLSTDITPPATGSKTFYVSYLFTVVQQGQLGTGNDGRYMVFLDQNNLGLPTNAAQTWSSFFNTFNSTSKYVAHGLLDKTANGLAYIAPCDTSVGKDFSTSTFTVPLGPSNGAAPPAPSFVVGVYTFNATGSDTMSMWVNPATNSFGGPTPPVSPIQTQTMAYKMPDIAGLCLLDRPGNGQAGGVGTNFVGNLLLGSTWSYVTGGPEFSSSPASTVGSVGSTVTLSGVAATAAAQSVTYQWAHVFGGTTNILTDGLANPGGSATVSGSTTTSLTLAGIQNGDTNGVYVAIATASGTGFSLASAGATVGYDPLITGQPQEYFTTPGGSATFTITATTASGPLSYRWQMNGANLSDVTLGDGSIISGSGTSTLTIMNAQKDENNSTITCGVTNALGAGELSAPATLITTDPAITVETHPVAQTTNYGGTATFTVSALTTPTNTPLTYAWYNGATMLQNGPTGTGSVASGATGSSGASNSLIAVLTLTNVSYLDNGSYTLIVTNKGGISATSAVATLFVNDPYIGATPAFVEVAQGGTATIPIVAAGYNATYQWASPGGPLSGDFSGATTPTLTVSGAQLSDAGSYYLTVTGVTNTLQSANVPLYVDAPITGLSLFPSNLTQQVSTHFALSGIVAGGVPGLLYESWQFNGTNVTNGIQHDGSLISGASTATLVVSNLHTGDAGTYTLTVSNAGGVFNAQSVVQVSSGLLAFSTADLVVTRVGEGAEPLSGSTGNTLYLDQYTTNGIYVNSTMVPDSGPNAIVVAGGGIEGSQEAYLTLSSNQQYLNFGGFCYNYPFTGGADVTAGGASSVRGIYALNGSGILALTYTNYGLYSGGHGFRDVYSTDGLINYWTTGSASSQGTVKYVNAGPAGAAYTITTPGQGIPALPGTTGTVPLSGGVCLGLNGTNLVFSDNETEGDATVANVWGLDTFGGTPFAPPSPFMEILDGGEGHATDFAFSPDSMTVYTANDDNSALNGGNGGIQRYDYSSGTGLYEFAYYLVDTSGVNTNGLKGLAVVWPTNITSWGAGVSGATLYATTSEATNNRIIQIADTGGQNSSTTVVATSGPNQFFHGIRFAPITVPLAVVTPPASQAAVVGQSVDFEVSLQGTMTYYKPNVAGTAYNVLDATGATFQWYTNHVAIPGATNLTYNIPNVQMSNAASYTFVVSNRFYGAVTSSPPAVLTVSPFTANTDMVGWFKLNDGSGTTAADSSGYNNPGTLQGFPGDNSEWVPGPEGFDVLNFANVDTNLDNVVVVPNAPQLNFNTNLAFTLAAWINSGTNTQINGAAIVTKGYGNGGESYDLDLFGSAHRFFVRSASGSVSAINTAVVPPTHQWEHVVATFDGNENAMSLYINGVLVSNILAPNSLLASTNPVSIGSRTSSLTNSYNFPFYGEMQDVRIYAAALGAQDVASLYQVLAVSNTPSRIIVSPPPGFVGNNFKLSFSGAPNTAYRLWSTTDLSITPIIGGWTLVNSGSFGASGTVTFTDTAAAAAARYYVITQP